MVSLECNVLMIAAVTRLPGQIMDEGVTRKRLQIPAIEKPISWVDMSNSHWSVLAMKPINEWNAEVQAHMQR
jgi:hypothetical protein